MSGDSRRFSEEEAASVLGQAIRMASERKSAQEEHDSSLTLEDLQRIGGEVGLDPDTVATAAHLLPEEYDSGGKFYLSGRPSYASYEVVVPGEIDADGWSDMLRRIRNTYGDAGTVTEEDGRYQYSTSADRGGTVKVTCKDGKTRISVTRGYFTTTFLTYFLTTVLGGFVAAGAGVALGISVHVIVGVVYAITLMLMMLVGARAWLASSGKKDRRKMKQLTQALGQIAVSGSKQAAGYAPSAQQLEERLQQST